WAKRRSGRRRASSPMTPGARPACGSCVRSSRPGATRPTRRSTGRARPVSATRRSWRRSPTSRSRLSPTTRTTSPVPSSTYRRSSGCTA
ncbi:MAG: hypothetical protein AVDCRST_MAG05-867, partial [uncultured Rubrobacteraceae bacterium]